MIRRLSSLRRMVPRNRMELLERLQDGEGFSYLLFYSHHQKKEGKIDQSCLSQWFPASFTIDDVHYSTAEHYMMAEKARLFDEALLEDILNAPHPKDAKALGRCVQNFDSDVWNACAFDIVIRGNTAKFSQNADLKSFLLGVEESVLVEAAPSDGVWGIGLNRHDKYAKNPFKWKGQNMLGFALTIVKSSI